MNAKAKKYSAPPVGAQIGAFTVSLELYELEPTMVAEIYAMMSFIPMGVRYDENDRMFYCWGISHIFKVVEPGDQPPEYRLVVSSEGGAGEVTGVTAELVH